jgi:hypothetical protein
MIKAVNNHSRDIYVATICLFTKTRRSPWLVVVVMEIKILLNPTQTHTHTLLLSLSIHISSQAITLNQHTCIDKAEHFSYDFKSRNTKSILYLTDKKKFLNVLSSSLLKTRIVSPPLFQGSCHQELKEKTDNSPFSKSFFCKTSLLTRNITNLS